MVEYLLPEWVMHRPSYNYGLAEDPEGRQMKWVMLDWEKTEMILSGRRVYLQGPDTLFRAVKRSYLERPNARSRGRWSKQQENRLRKLQEPLYGLGERTEEFSRMLALACKKEHYIKLQNPRDTRLAKEQRNHMIDFFLAIAKDLQ